MASYIAVLLKGTQMDKTVSGKTAQWLLVGTYC